MPRLSKVVIMVTKASHGFTPAFEIARQHDQERMGQDHADRRIGDVLVNSLDLRRLEQAQQGRRCCAPERTGRASA